MGLSNEERLYRFFYRCVLWKRCLEKLRDSLKEQPLKEGYKTVQGRLDRIDLIVGRQISCLDTNTVYWILGPNDTNFRSLFQSPYNIDDGRYLRPPEYAQRSIEWWEDDATMAVFVSLFRGEQNG
jgi:hypothetical protein